MTNQEINERVAKGLGWQKIDTALGPAWARESDPTRRIDPKECPTMDYCTDIRAAWEVMESLHPTNGIALTQHLQPPYGWSCTMWTAMTEEPDFSVRADTAPMAICLAYLKLLEDK